MRKFLIPVIAAPVLAVAAPAAADEKVTAVVSFADLDLAAPAGRETLERRIAAAVINVCGEPGINSLRFIKAVEECRAKATEDAMAQLESHLAKLPTPTIASAR